MRRAWDDVQRQLADWEAVLEGEGLGVIGVGPDEHGHGRKDILSLTPALEASVSGSVWDLAAAVGALAEAVSGYRFDHVVDVQICVLLSRRVPWHRIALTVGCSKRRVSLVSKLVVVWRQQRADLARQRDRIDELLSDARERRG